MILYFCSIIRGGVLCKRRSFLSLSKAIIKKTCVFQKVNKLLVNKHDDVSEKNPNEEEKTNEKDICLSSLLIDQVHVSRPAVFPNQWKLFLVKTPPRGKMLTNQNCP